MEGENKRGGVLAFFGMETFGKSCETLACLFPTILVSVAALALISYLFTLTGLVELSIAKFAMAIGIAILFSFFTLARLRAMNISGDSEDEGESAVRKD